MPNSATCWRWREARVAARVLACPSAHIGVRTRGIRTARRVGQASGGPPQTRVTPVEDPEDGSLTAPTRLRRTEPFPISPHPLAFLVRVNGVHDQGALVHDHLRSRKQMTHSAALPQDAPNARDGGSVEPELYGGVGERDGVRHGAAPDQNICTRSIARSSHGAAGEERPRYSMCRQHAVARRRGVAIWHPHRSVGRHCGGVGALLRLHGARLEVASK
jgi:hypothetical protein